MRFDVLTTVTAKISVSWNLVLRAATATFLLLTDRLTPRLRTQFSGTHRDWSGWLPSRTLEVRFQFQTTSFGWHWCRFFFDYVGFPRSASFHRSSMLIQLRSVFPAIDSAVKSKFKHIFFYCKI